MKIQLIEGFDYALNADNDILWLREQDLFLAWQVAEVKGELQITANLMPHQALFRWCDLQGLKPVVEVAQNILEVVAIICATAIVLGALAMPLFLYAHG